MRLCVKEGNLGMFTATSEDPLSIVRAARAMAAAKLEEATAVHTEAFERLDEASAAKGEVERALRDLDAWLAAQELQR